ncbi:hypothetical protein A9G42_05340 [Gilliamella sp. Nev6-6]|jgi:hypothetical protein|uniref:hypothetical protein n=1 Tax=Gilliamella sp. Nev6-6 TaxID=3120252 RepID=UPI00080F4B50|nr:hypothetical protein [Gilliamella apicola]OCG77330.1 hypothetical protein A9G42_05340 [Gilliamella apicola]
MEQKFKNYRIDAIDNIQKKTFKPLSSDGNIRFRYNAVYKIIMIAFYILLVINWIYCSFKVGRETILSDFFNTSYCIFSIVISFIIALFFYLMTKPNLIAVKVPIPRWERIKFLLGHFFQFFLCSLFITICLPINLVHLYPGNTYEYLTDYEITTPGPQKRHYHRYANGIKIHDPYTSKKFFLPFTKNDADIYPKKLLVTIKSNFWGSYLIDYKLYDKAPQLPKNNVIDNSAKYKHDYNY